MKGSVAAAIAALASALHVGASDVITDDTFFYGQSPPVYPSPEINPTGAWSASFSKAKHLVDQMTLEEKVVLTSGVSSKTACSGTIAAIERLGFPGLCLTDAGQGVRSTDFVSSFPSGIHVGASWNKELALQRGAAMGAENKKKGVNVLLGPVVGPAWRVTRGGRNWEGFAADPYLSGVLAASTVKGVQGQGVMTSVKHYIANEQEAYRNPDPSGKPEAISSNLDDKTMHEFYLWPFQDTIKAGAVNIMCSYQRVNNSYGCANSKTLNGLLKTELGFQGFVVSDWAAQHAGVATTLAGMDMVMPSGDKFWGAELVKSVQNGTVSEARVSDMAIRILASWYQLNQDTGIPKPGIGMPKDIRVAHDIVDARDPGARPILSNGAIEGHVLVKNTKNTLPLKKPRMLSLFGYSAKTPDVVGPTANELTYQSWALGAQAIKFTEIISAAISGPNGTYSSIGINGTLFGGCGSGATTGSNSISPFEALKARTYQDGTAVFNDFGFDGPAVNPASDACIVFGNAWACEVYDRPALWDNYTDTLISKVADQCSKTIVVLHNAGPRVVDGFANHPNVTAIIFAHLPGQDSGNALVSLLYGDANFSGKLPYTVAKNDSDYGSLLNPDTAEGKYINFPQSDFKEGVFIDYRHFDKHNITPRYEFGYGLSYTTFTLSNLNIQLLSSARTDEWPAGTVIPGGQADLFDDIFYIKADLANTGSVPGAEVAQLYITIPGQDGTIPVRQLRGFEKRHLAPGQTITLTFAVNRRDLSVWSVEKQMWRLQRGEYQLFIGRSSRAIDIKGSLTI